MKGDSTLGTQHASDGIRLVCFDNAHPVRGRQGPGTRRRCQRNDRLECKDASTRLDDFSKGVDAVVKG